MKPKAKKKRETSARSSEELGIATTGLVAVAAFLLFGLNNTETAALPAYAMELGSGPFVASLQNSLFVLLAVLLRTPLEGLVARRGARFAMIAGTLGYTVPCLFLAICASLRQVIVLRLLQAFGLALFQPSVAQYLAAISTNATLGKRLGFVRFATTTSLMVGPMITFPLIDAYGHKSFFEVLALAGTCGIAIALALPKDSRSSTPDQSSKDAPFSAQAKNAPQAPSQPQPQLRPQNQSQRRLLLAIPLLLALGYSAVMNFGQTLSEEALANYSDGMLFAFLSVGGMTGSLISGWFTDHFKVKRTVACAVTAEASGLLLLGLGSAAETVLAGALLCGVGYFGSTTALVTAAGLIPDRGTTAFLARQQSSLDVGMIIGGALAGLMLQGGLSLSSTLVTISIFVGIGLLSWGIMYPNGTERH